MKRTSRHLFSSLLTHNNWGASLVSATWLVLPKCRLGRGVTALCWLLAGFPCCVRTAVGNAEAAHAGNLLVEDFLGQIPNFFYFL